jgi:hypothetical protein
MSTGFLPRIQPREELASQTTLQGAGAGTHTPGRADQQADYDTFLKPAASNGKRRRRTASSLGENQGVGHREQADRAATSLLLKYSQ